MSKLLYDELYELTINFDRHQFIKLLMEKDRKIQDLSTDKQQLNMLVNSCQNEIRKLKEQTNQEDIQQYISAKKSPVHSCIELSKYFIGRHTTLPVYLTSQFENEFNSKMYLLEITQQENQELKKQLNDYKNRYTNRLNSQLAENIEPDEEDFYLSEIEIKANYYDKLVSKQKDFVEYLEDEIKECNSYSKYIKKKPQELKKQLEVGKQQYNDLVEEKEKLQEQLSSNTLQFENQQKEFIRWLESEIKACELTCDLIFNHNKEMKIYKEILSKYKEIIGDKE